jgi:hypothetical protein
MTEAGRSLLFELNVADMPRTLTDSVILSGFTGEQVEISKIQAEGILSQAQYLIMLASGKREPKVSDE